MLKKLFISLLIAAIIAIISDVVFGMSVVACLLAFFLSHIVIKENIL